MRTCQRLVWPPLCGALLFACGEPVDDDPWECQLGQHGEALVGEVGADPNPFTWWWYATEPQHRGTLMVALDCALERWRDATCLPLNVSFDAHHWVRALVMEEWSGIAYPPWDASRIRVDAELAENKWCPVLTHEIGHVLRRSTGHSAIDGSMSYPTVHVNSEPVSHIVDDDINRVCAKHACNCIQPE